MNTSGRTGIIRCIPCNNRNNSIAHELLVCTANTNLSLLLYNKSHFTTYRNSNPDLTKSRISIQQASSATRKPGIRLPQLVTRMQAVRSLASSNVDRTIINKSLPTTPCPFPPESIRTHVRLTLTIVALLQHVLRTILAHHLLQPWRTGISANDRDLV